MVVFPPLLLLPRILHPTQLLCTCTLSSLGMSYWEREGNWAQPYLNHIENLLISNHLPDCSPWIKFSYWKLTQFLYILMGVCVFSIQFWTYANLGLQTFFRSLPFLPQSLPPTWNCPSYISAPKVKWTCSSPEHDSLCLCIKPLCD